MCEFKQITIAFAYLRIHVINALPINYHHSGGGGQMKIVKSLWHTINCRNLICFVNGI